jgi:hypothetical protein
LIAAFNQLGACATPTEFNTLLDADPHDPVLQHFKQHFKP